MEGAMSKDQKDGTLQWKEKAFEPEERWVLGRVPVLGFGGGGGGVLGFLRYCFAAPTVPFRRKATELCSVDGGWRAGEPQS